jgi:disulfide bond formation protein DsbB
LADYGLYFAWLVTLVATGGSLYFSEVRHFIPCALCWWQRIFMYPLVFVLGIASFRQDKTAVSYALPLAIVGGLTSVYHIILQNTTWLGAPAGCAVGVPCNAKYINWLGFISIPVLALTAFVLITGFLLMSRSVKN